VHRNSCFDEVERAEGAVHPLLGIFRISMIRSIGASMYLLKPFVLFVFAIYLPDRGNIPNESKL
jgi:hypothetical protein